MRKRQRKKLEKMVGNTERMVTALEAAYSSIMTISQALQTMIREIQSYLTRFPMKVEDWATNPPLHNGEYIIWFVKKDQETESRKYTFAGGKWYSSQGAEIDIRRYKPSMWMLLPTFDPGVIEIYKRRQE